MSDSLLEPPQAPNIKPRAIKLQGNTKRVATPLTIGRLVVEGGVGEAVGVEQCIIISFLGLAT